MKGVRTIRNKLIVAALLPTLLMAVTAAFTAFTINTALIGVGTLFDKNYFLQELLSDTSIAKSNLSSYMETKNSENLRQYIHYSRLLAEKASLLDPGTRGNENSLIERNIANLLKEFISAGDAAVQAKRGRNIGEYAQRFNRVEELSASIRERANAMVLARLDAQLTAFSAFSQGMARVRVLNALTIAMAFLFGFFVILYYTRKISLPIIHLGLEANKIASGVFDDTQLGMEADDEIGAAARAFNLMKQSIQDSLNALRNNAEIERALMAERVKNLEMAGLLRNAELSALQARINPHFLFNTLNTGIQLAVVEEADKTRNYLERLTRLMRYSFRDLEAPVALSEEIECLQSYLYLMSIRFPGVFTFRVSVESPAERAIMPKMIIQPLVENAIRHGLRDKTEGAALTVQADLQGEDLRILIEDNGTGIADDRVQEIFQAASEGRDTKNDDHGGLGFANVIRRLRLFSGKEGVIEISPVKPSGTRITITIPFREDY